MIIVDDSKKNIIVEALLVENTLDYSHWIVMRYMVCYDEKVWI